MSAFEELGVMPEIIRAVEEMDWLLPTPVQAEAIPLILGGGDVCVAAETGSGKTGAFCLPTVQIVHETLAATAAAAAAPEESAGADQAQPTRESPRRVCLSRHDRDPLLAIDESGCVCQSRDARQWQGCRATHGVSRGKWYFEATPDDEGLCRVGWSAAAATLELGKDATSYGYGGTGKKSSGGSFDDYGEPYGKGDVIGCGVDLDAGQVWFSRNGRHLGSAFTGVRGNGGAALYPAILLKNAQMRIAFSAPALASLPSGYRAFGTAQAHERATPESEGVRDVQGRDRAPNAPLLFIIEPTRELAQQVDDELDKFAAHLDPAHPVRHELIVGGVNPKEQARALAEGGVDIVTGTPGRLADFIKSGKLDVRSVRFLVLDEADALIAQGHTPLIMDIYRRIPKQGRRHRLQTLLLSATLHSREVRALGERVQETPTWVDLKGQDAVPDTVDHGIVWVDPLQRRDMWPDHGAAAQLPPTDKVHEGGGGGGGGGIDAKHPATLSHAVKLIKPQLLVRVVDAHDMEQAMVFCRTQLDCDNLERYLRRVNALKYPCAVLHGGRSVAERRANLQRFKDGEARLLVCTDVAARGVDVVGLPYLINMTLPDDVESYIHRAGRVGRADRTGLAVSLVSAVRERVWFHASCRDRGRGGCQNRELVANGGCTVWLDEPAFLDAVRERLAVSERGSQLVELREQPDGFRMPTTTVAAAAAAAEGSAAGGAPYGTKRSSGADGADGEDKSALAVARDEAKARVESLRPTVRLLADMEKQAQLSFLSMLASSSSSSLMSLSSSSRYRR